MGFGEVFDYMAGKADWLAFGLPTEGKEADRLRAGNVAIRDVPTCAVSDRMDDVRTIVSATDWNSCVVVGERGVVLGRVHSDDLRNGDGEQRAEAVMELGPSSVRQSECVDELVDRMQEQSVDDILVTNSIGELVGVLRRDDGERRLNEANTS